MPRPKTSKHKRVKPFRIKFRKSNIAKSIKAADKAPPSVLVSKEIVNDMPDPIQKDTPAPKATDDDFAFANLQNDILNSLPDGMDSKTAQEVSYQAATRIRRLADLNDDGVVSESELNLDLKVKREGFERWLVIGALVLSGATVFIPLISSIAWPEIATPVSGLQGLLIAAFTGFIALPAAYLGIKTYMNAKSDYAESQNTVQVELPADQANLSIRG